MSIQPISTAFRNISMPSEYPEEFWINTQGFTTNAQGSMLSVPGIYTQGATILKCSLLLPGLAVDWQGSLQISTANNINTNQVLYASIGFTGAQAGSALGQTLNADSWLNLSLNDATFPVQATGQSIGLAVKYTTLTQSRLFNNQTTNYPQS